ncbi:hypothetical protein BB560_001046 [Smittium megazygosporum]|uniref:Major facilitator superfamily (MFS) profile domain-containing protein n=1 Tax=Smittium megazygosporum TaxID=133381 RepID=A0A2T9ZIM1_9FUNG|nr:hypothetical protein BB560_001046 [Smittium megazygosporum]
MQTSSKNDIEVQEKVLLNVLEELTEEQEELLKSSLRKRDWRILPITMLLYICALMDRSNIGSALVNGLVDGLKLSPVQEGNVTSMFYVFYILFETPSNILLKRFSPHLWFAFIGSSWSICCILLGIVKRGSIFVIIRSIMGAFEAGFTPGMIGYLGYWYTRKEVGTRMTIFFTALPIAGVIGAPLAGLFASIKIPGLLPFQNIFILEGAITLAICIASFFIILDYPDKATFFTPEEYELTVTRIRVDQGMASKSKISLKRTLAPFKDWKMWVFCLIFLGYVNVYIVIGIFSPTLIKSFGYTSIQATYLAIIPNATGLVGVILVLRFLNKVKYSYMILAYSLITIFGYSVAVFYRNRISSLVFLGIAGFGTMANVSLSLTWMSVNQGGIYKGLIVSAFVISVGNIAGVASPRTFTKNFAPNYILGNILCVGLIVLSSVCVAILSIFFIRTNHKRDTKPVDVSHLSEEEQRDMNDFHPNFRYIP